MMDGEHIEMIIGGWSSTTLRKQALDELVAMREELAVLRERVSELEHKNSDWKKTAANLFSSIALRLWR